jgi:hypothetical protein
MTAAANSQTVVDWRFKPQGPVLRRFQESQAEVCAIMGPIGSGKTAASIAKILTHGILGQAPHNGMRRTRGMIVRNTYPDLTNTTIRDWIEVIPESLGKLTRGHPPEQTLLFQLEDETWVHAEVLFVALDREDHVRKMRGFQASWIWLNEAKELPKGVLDMATGRLGRYPRKVDGGATRPLLVMDYNAPDEDHWLYELEQDWRAGKLPDFEFCIQPGGMLREGELVRPNPNAENVQNLRDGYYQRIAQGKSLDWIKVNLCNEYGFVGDGKPVHSDYVDTVHGSTEALEPVKGQPIYVGMDFGLTPAATFMQPGAFGNWIAFDELVCFDAGAEEFAELLQRKVAEYPGHQWIFRGDPAGDQRAGTDKRTVFQVLRANGIPAMPCTSNDPGLRRDALARVLRRMRSGKPAFQVGPKCRYLRKALAGGWCYKRVKVAGTERFHMEPDKNMYSHIGESCEYALLDGGEKATIPAHQPQQGSIVVQNDWSPV